MSRWRLCGHDGTEGRALALDGARIMDQARGATADAALAALGDAPGDDAWPPGLLALKGGDLSEEIADLRAEDPDVTVDWHPLDELLGANGFFGEKKIVVVRS